MELTALRWSDSEIAEALGLHSRTVRRWQLRWNHENSIGDKYENCRGLRACTEDDDLDILLCSHEMPTRTAAEIHQILGLPISVKTIQRRLKEGGLHSCIARKKELLLDRDIERRLDWGERMDGFQFWNSTYFTDESPFWTSPTHKVHVYCPLGTDLEPCYLQTVRQSGRQCVSVWGCISALGIGLLHRIRGRFNTHEYTRLLDNVFLPFATKQFPAGFYYLQDNSPIHTGHVVKDWMFNSSGRMNGETIFQDNTAIF